MATNKKLKTVLIDVWENSAHTVEVDHALDAFYKMLNCDLIDFAYISIGGKEYAVMCDDEGLFQEDIRPSLISHTGMPLLVGSLMFFLSSDDGDILSLQPEDIDIIRSHLVYGDTNPMVQLDESDV